MYTRTLFILATVSLLGGTGSAQSTTMNHGPMTMPAGNAAGRMAPMDVAAEMAALQKLSGRAFDRAFLSMMIPHHQMALDMARAVLPRSRDARVRTWATAIIANQQREITQMSALLRPLGGPEAKLQDMMRGAVMGMGQQVTASKTPDRTFVAGMVPHHAGAIQMATLALQKGSSPAVLKLAHDIVRAQAQEMYDFQLWLRRA